MMTERKIVHKWFWVWDFDKEERWLNEMAMNGWKFVGVGFCRYTFEKCEQDEYTIRLEMHNSDDAYLSFMKETGAEYVGRMVQWIYFRKKTELGQFDIFSDIDSKIKHLDKISKMLAAIGFANLLIGIANTINSPHIGWMNLICATLLMYALGRIHGKKDSLEQEGQLHE